MLSAILFDLDGTLVNTDPLHFAIWQDLLTQFKLDIDRNFYQQHISGRTNAEILQDILPQLSFQEASQFALDKEIRFRELAQELQPMPGLERMLAWIETNNLKTAVVTNAPRDNAIHMLDVLQLSSVFPLVILAEDAPPGKPDPAPYQLALSRLNVESKEAIAFEDSASGIRAAVGAGIFTIGVASTHPPESLVEAGATMVIKDFTSDNLWQFIERKISIAEVRTGFLKGGNGSAHNPSARKTFGSRCANRSQKR
ncbi:HAD-IA family hydrolase [Pleurocapsales cyanobacterium LEGE 06147]|nr:HAD-IA family hydrolase [Pleurocapsales cyanobacterium LEGE 06147]